MAGPGEGEGDAGCRSAGGLFGILACALVSAVVLVCCLPDVESPGGVRPGSYTCDSTWTVPDVKKMLHKGIAMDDSTFACPEELPRYFPNTYAPVKALRLFRATQPGWDQDRNNDFARTVKEWAERNDARVLIGTQITCVPDADDYDWRIVKSLMQTLGPDRVMGVAVGNEIDELWKKTGTTQGCVNFIWGSYYLDKVKSRFQEMRSMPGFGAVPLTAVFTAGVLYGKDESKPFIDVPGAATVNSFYTNLLGWMKDNRYDPLQDFIFTLNFYPYFDPNLGFDSPTAKTCGKAIDSATCFGKPRCLTMASMIRARQRITQLTGDNTSRFWVGEVGWSSPMASTLTTNMSGCAEFSSQRTLQTYYQGFLRWDLTLPGGSEYGGPEQAFYFTMRDSGNFGHEEYFGLIAKCGDTQCKLQADAASADRRGTPPPPHDAEVSI